ncbi:MAG: menaquinone biosynthesis decarboxylase [Verrucomicrobia bacterium]|nr:menaquinone biosynthesis decarboxylase [Verrucomicrobiota bacterium]
MACASLREFVECLEREGELLHVPFEADPVLEITEFADRQMKSPGGGKALLFEKAKGSSFPLLINAFGSEKRMALAIGRSVDACATELESLLKAKPPTSFSEAIKLLGTALELRHAKPKSVGSGPCKEVVLEDDAVDLGKLPIPKCWPQDAGRFITLPMVFTQDPDTGARNVGMYRMQIIDRATTFMHWQMHKVAARHGRRYVETGQRMPVAVCLGGDPVYTFCATAPLPDGVDEVMLAGFLRQKSVEMVKCETIPLEVPGDCDFVIEGYVDPKEPPGMEGPFGDHTGYYTLPEPYPKFHITAITHRRDAIYPSTIVGRPPMEDFYLGDASVRLFLPVMKMNFPELVDIYLPPEGVFHNMVIVSLKKSFPYHAMKLMHGLWGMGQMMFTKCFIMVDADVNVRDMSEVAFRACANVDPARDILLTKGPADVLDHATPALGFGSKMGIDATHKLPGERDTRPWPPIIKMDDEVKRRVDALLTRMPKQ